MDCNEVHLRRRRNLLSKPPHSFVSTKALKGLQMCNLTLQVVGEVMAESELRLKEWQELPERPWVPTGPARQQAKSRKN